WRRLVAAACRARRGRGARSGSWLLRRLFSLPLARGGGEGTLHRGGLVVVLAWLDGAPLARRHLLAAATANGSDGVDANVRPQRVPVLRRRIAHAASVAYAWSHPPLHRLYWFSASTGRGLPHSRHGPLSSRGSPGRPPGRSRNPSRYDRFATRARVVLNLRAMSACDSPRW